jgi:hypothetical protein
MFEDLIVFAMGITILIVVRFIISVWISPKHDTLRVALKICGVVGITVHELSHFVMCIVTGAHPEGISVSYRRQTGQVRLKDAERMTFMQGFLTCLAPLLIISYLLYWCIVVFLSPITPDIWRGIVLISFISLGIGVSPSRQDIRIVGLIFNKDPLYSLYQIGLVTLSTLIIFFTTHGLPIPYYYSFIFYVLIGMGYYALKYLFLGIKMLGEYTYSHYTKRQNTLSAISQYRVRHQPKNKKKQQIKRGQW